MLNRKRIAEVLEVGDKQDRLSKFIDIALILLISCNVIAIIFESVGELHAQYKFFFYGLEVFSVALFTVEYFLRIYCSPDVLDEFGMPKYRNRWHYLISPMAIIDFISIFPCYLAAFFTLDLRFLRVVRLLRMFKLTRYSGAMGVLFNVFRDESSTFFAAFFILFIVLVLSSSGIYLIEHAIQPEAFGSIPASMWWAMATLTTVGYGDVTPITPLGKFFGGVITLVGMGMVALPAGILASGFSNQMHRAQKQYNQALDAVLEDGAITRDEEEDLEELRRDLGLSRMEARELYISAIGKEFHRIHTCPHCGSHLHEDPVADEDEDEDQV